MPLELDERAVPTVLAASVVVMMIMLIVSPFVDDLTDEVGIGRSADR